MSNFIIVGYIILIMISTSCKSQNIDAENKDEIKEVKQDSKEDLLKEGYSIGIVRYLENSKCPYIIIDEKTNVKFDPINFDEEKFASFKKDSDKIFYKYYPLRMMNRCNEAQPISLADIKKRED